MYGQAETMTAGIGAGATETSGAAGDGDLHAATPALGAAILATGRAGRNLRELRNARQEIEDAMRDLLDAARREGPPRRP